MIRDADQEAKRRYDLVNTNPINEVMHNLNNYFTSSPVLLDVTKLPEIICLKYLAYYVALSSKKFLNYDEILWEDSSWLNNATRIHIVFRKTLEKKIGITLSHSMYPAQLRIARNYGVVLIASVGSEGNISNLLSCDVTKELALDLLKQSTEFSYLCGLNIIESTLLKSDDQLPSRTIVVEKNIEEVIDSRLKKTLKQNIKDINPRYNGSIWDKTSVPHVLILKTMCIILELNYSKITWSTVKDFIEEHILPDHKRSSLTQLRYIDDHVLEVGESTVQKKSCQDRVSEYKKDVFNIN